MNLITKTLFASLLCASPAIYANEYSAQSSKIKSLSVSYKVDVGCYVTDEGALKCWNEQGIYGRDLAQPGRMEGALSVKLGAVSGCAEYTDGLYCWAGLGNPPQMNQIEQYSVGGRHACVLGDGTIKCWGSNEFGQLDLPQDIVNPSFVFAGGQYTCFTDANGFHCVGDDTWTKEFPPELTNPTAIAESWQHMCAIQSGRVFCWGSGSWNQQEIPTHLVFNNPVELIVGWVHTCVRDDDGVKCWGVNYNNQTDVPDDFRDAAFISAGSHSTCGINATQDRVGCWGAMDGPNMP